jgi:hypothetical protein
VARLRRALEKARRELAELAGSIRRAEGSDHPTEAYAQAERGLDELLEFLDQEAQRLEDKILSSGGLEPGRVRRSSSR